MKQIISKTGILKANAINTYNVETAYFTENWMAIIVNILQILVLLVFIRIIYRNINLFAGYTETEMLFLILIVQISKSVESIWSLNNIQGMIDLARYGGLDMLLVKPVPSLFFITFKDVSIVNSIKNGLPNLILLSIIIDWSLIKTNMFNMIFGVLIFVCGQIAWHCFRFLFTLPVFAIGTSHHLFEIPRNLNETHNIPYEGFPDNLRKIFLTLVPSLIASQACVSVLLSRSNPYTTFILVFTVTIVFLVLKLIGWRISLNNYSSASS